LGHGVFLTQLWTCAWVVFFTLMVSIPVAWRVGRPAFECVIFTCVDVVVACWLAMRVAGMKPDFGRQNQQISADARGPAAG
jgi:hypothetical protein